jgi:hypothetical protein
MKTKKKKKKKYVVYDEAGGEVDFSFWKHGIYLWSFFGLIVLALIIAAIPK